jgi:aminocarboxymuconate-semialdehyde decarboxylase
MHSCTHEPAGVTRRCILGLCGLAATLLTGAGAREALGQTKKTGRTIDTHAHYFPEAFLKAVAEEGPPPSFPLDMSVPSEPAVSMGAVRVKLDPTYWDLDKRMVRMNEQGVQMHALSLTAPMVHWATPERGARLARIVNDSMESAHTAHPDRFVGCATLPLQDPTLAVAEINRVSAFKGIRGIYMPTNVGGKELGDLAHFPVFERCEALNLPVLLHPAGVVGQERLAKNYYLSNLLGNPFDSTIAAATLVFGGVLDRFPKLNVVLPHAGGALPYLFGRLQHGQDTTTRSATLRRSSGIL